ncbi:unnamed protein product, partial [Porites lobata]
LEVQWIPRTENEKADYISRLIDFDDWQITRDLFLSLEELWGPHTVDSFANYYTAKLPRFFSRFWNPGASGIVFFAQELSSENSAENLVPPVSLVACVIPYLSLQKAMATLVVPLWPSSSFWPLLTGKYRSLIKGCFTLNASQALTLLNGRPVVVASKAWMVLPPAIRPDFHYLFKYQQLRSPAAMVLVHAALKWFHSFVPDDGPNPLDNACCKNLIECAKRTRSNPVHKKKPVDPAIIRSIIDRHGAEEESLKDLRIAAIRSLGFAGLFRFNELANIQPKHLSCAFCDGFVKIFVPRSKTDVYREGNYVYIGKL